MSRSFDSITHDDDHHHAPTPSQQQQQVSKNGKPSLPSQNTTKNENNQHSTSSSSSFVHCHNFLDKIFTNCSNDPVGNVHRTWSITLLMMAIYLIITIFQSKCVWSLVFLVCVSKYDLHAITRTRCFTKRSLTPCCVVAIAMFVFLIDSCIPVLTRQSYIYTLRIVVAIIIIIIIMDHPHHQPYYWRVYGTG